MPFTLRGSMRFERQETIQPQDQQAVRTDYVVVPTCCGLVVVQIDETGDRRSVAHEEVKAPAAQSPKRVEARPRSDDDVEAGIFKRPSRLMSDPLFVGLSRGVVVRHGLATMAVVLVAYIAAVNGVGHHRAEATTVSLLTLGLALLLQVLHLIQNRVPSSAKDMAGTCGLLAALGLCGLIVLLAAWVPLAAALQLTPPPMSAWGMILGLAVLPVIVVRLIEFCETRTHDLALVKQSNACR